MEEIFEEKGININNVNVKLTVNKARRLVLVEDVKENIRGKLWKLLLGVFRNGPNNCIYSTDTYLSLLYPHTLDNKIRNDTFRTFPTDFVFTQAVNEHSMVRILNAFANNTKQDPPDSPFQFSYVQGMNVLVAPFLFVMPEIDAFFAFNIFIRKCLPSYVQPSLEGVHKGVKLVDRCLKVIDPELFEYLTKKKLTAEVYAFSSILTLCCCTPPLSEAIKLWDFLIAFGVHLVVLCTVAQLILIKEDILKSESPMKLLSPLPPLKARQIISLTVKLVNMLPNDLYDELVYHPLTPPDEKFPSPFV